MISNDKNNGYTSRLSRLIALLIALIAGLNCPTVSAQDVSNDIITDDDLLLRVNDELPGFGGMFYDDQGQLNVYIVNLDSVLESDKKNQRTIDDRIRNIESILTNIYGEKHLKSGSGRETSVAQEKKETRPPSMKLLSGTYTIRQLIEWRLTIIDLLTNKNVIFLDMDETKNKITIGVLDDQTKEDAYRYTQMKGIPRSAINVEIVKPIKEFQSLISTTRPVVAGLQIHNPGLGRCTLGVNAYRQINTAIPDAWNRGFLTNSHCTKRFGSVNSDTIFQSNAPAPPDVTDPSYVGYEIVDPRLRRCYFVFNCRYSDAAFVRYSLSTNWTLGQIAKPLTANTGTLVIDSVLPAFSIVGEQHNPVAGEYLHKVGRTTGWTWGRLSRTCIDRFNDMGILLRCQHLVRRATGSGQIGGRGDSGSPVFKRHGGFRHPDVTFYGLVWGGNEDGTEFVFSSIKYMEKELHDLRVAVGSEPPEPPPPPSCPAGEQCCWINYAGNCYCIPDNQQCPNNPFGGCPDGFVCCEPGEDDCFLCRRASQRCP
jgi:hypothetical protein